MLEEINPEQQDVVAVIVHRLSPMASAEYQLHAGQICSEREIEILSKVVTVAEKAGKHVELLVVPATDPSSALVQVAQYLQSARIISSPYPQLSSDEQARP